MHGVSLLLRYPGVAAVSCRRCQDVLGDFVDGEWVPSRRAGVEIPRPKGSKTPCWKCPKLSEEDQKNDPVPAKAVELSSNNWRAWLYYQEVQAGATMAEDPMTRRLCGLLRMVEQGYQRQTSRQAEGFLRRMALRLRG